VTGAVDGRRFAGKVAVVAGAGSGIGEACATRFAAEGASVVVVDWAEKAALEVAEAIAAAGGTAEAYVADVATEDGAAGVVAFAVERFGGLDVLHNNAFGMQAGLLEDITLEGWNETLRLTLTGAFLGTRAAIPVLAGRGGGAIVNTASVSGAITEPGLGPYSVAKAGVMALTRSTAVEYGREGIRCNAVCPSTVETPAFLQTFGEATTASWLTGAPPGRRPATARTADDLRAMREGKADAHATGRLIQPAEVAALVTWLASADASSVTGGCYPVDGGLSARSAGPTAT
jgi:NAD(P)-dependent dehydrogenase (short-subunit alcohol dehydrogenase family)